VKPREITITAGDDGIKFIIPIKEVKKADNKCLEATS
jgi:hypothetical protein